MTVQNAPERGFPTMRRPAPSRLAPASNASSKRTLWPYFALINVVMIFVVGYGLGTSPNTTIGTGIFLVSLTALSFFPLCLTRSFRGPYALACVFMGLYFYSFATGDLAALLSNLPIPGQDGRELLSGSEKLILISAVFFLAGYGVAVPLLRRRTGGICQRDWSPTAIRICGIIFWMIGFCAVTAVQTSWKEVTAHPFWGQLGGFISLARLLNPLGALMISYLYTRSKEKSALLIFLLFCVMDFMLGFYGDTKEQAFRDPILFMIAQFLVSGRVPVALAIVIFTFAGMTFSFFAEYRHQLQSTNLPRLEAAQKVVKSLMESVGSSNTDANSKSFDERFGHGLEYVATRTTLKPSVEIIVEGTGIRAPFMHGSTIKPLIYAFIPRNIMPDKPDQAVGRIFNRAFHISASPDTFISPSQNGELYWNFGWPGVVIGMSVIGFIMGSVNGLVNFDTLVTLPRLLILLMTVYLICLRFEDGIAIQYTYWIRAILMLLLVHMFIPKAKNAR